MSNSPRTTWNLSPLLPKEGEKGFETEREKIEKANYGFINKWKDRMDYLEDPHVLIKALDEYEELNRLYGVDGNEGYYLVLRSSLDENDTNIKAKETILRDFAKRIYNDLQFFELRLAKVSEEVQQKFLTSQELGKYKHYLERLFADSKHLLSEPEEKIMLFKSSSSYGAWVQMTSGFLAKAQRKSIGEDGKKKLQTFEDLQSLIASQQKNVRKDAAAAVENILDEYKEVAEAEMNAILENKKVDDQLRGFTRPDESRHISDDVETETVDAMISAVSDKNDISIRFYDLKAKLLGQKYIEYYERSVSYGDANKDYSFEDAISLVKNVFEELDPEFLDILNRFLENGQIDIFPQKGKSGGAFCIHHSLLQPTYVLLNFTNKLRDVETIAHEMGHAINNELMRQKQHELYFGTPASTAEVASTFMEDFVNEKLMSGTDDELRLALMVNKLNGDISSIFRQVACYRFEQELHATYREKGYLSYLQIGEIFEKHMRSYMGDAGKRSNNWWVYWWHIRQFFYVYSYASGLLISKSMQAEVKKDKAFIQKVKTFLSSGMSASPKDIFSKMNIDITDKSFWKKGLEEIADLLDQTEKLAQKLGKI